MVIAVKKNHIKTQHDSDLTCSKTERILSLLIYITWLIINVFIARSRRYLVWSLGRLINWHKHTEIWQNSNTCCWATTTQWTASSVYPGLSWSIYSSASVHDNGGIKGLILTLTMGLLGINADRRGQVETGGGRGREICATRTVTATCRHVHTEECMEL